MTFKSSLQWFYVGIFLFFLKYSLVAQCVGPTDYGIVLDTQAKVDRFAQDYPNCSILETNLWINGSVTNLDGLSQLKEVRGQFSLESYELESLEGLQNLERITEGLSIFFGKFTNLGGLQSLKSVGSLLIHDITRLTTLDGLELDSIDKGLYIVENPKLRDLTALNSLSYIGENIRIEDNSQLNSLDGLNHMTGLNKDIRIVGNCNLSCCSALGICDRLNASTDGHAIWDNAPGCSSIAEIQSNCSDQFSCDALTLYSQEEVNAYAGITEISGDFFILGPDIVDLSSFSELRKVNGSLRVQYTNLEELVFPKLDNISGELNISDNALLSEIAVTSLETTLASITLSDNPALRSIRFARLRESQDIYVRCWTCEDILELVDLPNLVQATNIYIEAGSGQFELKMEDLTRVTSSLLLQGLGYKNIDFLSNLTNVGNDLAIVSTNLSHIDALENLIEVGGDLTLRSNQSLISIQGIDNCNILGDISITENSKLSDCDINMVCDALLGGKNIMIDRNGANCKDNRDLSTPCNTPLLGRFIRIDSNEDLLALKSMSLPEEIDELLITGDVTDLSEGIDLDIVTGDVFIINTGLTNLNGLQSLKTIRGALKISGNSSLKDFQGLNNLQSAKTVEVENNNVLESLKGLEKLVDVESPFSIDAGFNIIGNNNLRSLIGLSSLKKVHGGMTIMNNPMLENLRGLDSLVQVGSLAIYNNLSLNSLSGLENLISVGNKPISSRIEYDRFGLYIRDNPNLESLLSLQALKRIEGSLQLTNNDLLIDVTGLESLERIEGALYLTENQLLQSIKQLHSLNYLGASFHYQNIWHINVKMSLFISDNLRLGNLEGLASIDTLFGTLHIERNRGLYDISALQSINHFGSDYIVVINNTALSICCLPLLYNAYYSSTQFGSDQPYIDRVSIVGNLPICSSLSSFACGALGEHKSVQDGIFPNPVTDVFSTKDETQWLQIFDSSGRRVSTFANMQTYDISSFKPGVYFVRYTFGGEVYDTKLIKD